MLPYERSHLFIQRAFHPFCIAAATAILLNLQKFLKQCPWQWWMKTFHPSTSFPRSYAKYKVGPDCVNKFEIMFSGTERGGGGQGLSQGAQQRVTFERPCSSTTISRATKEVLSGKFRGYSSVGWVGNNEIDEGVSRNNVAVKGTGKQLPPSI